MENNCKMCLFYDKCQREGSCDNFSIAGDEVDVEEYFDELHSEYFNDFQSYLEEFFR